MLELSAIEKLRLENLRALHGMGQGVGAPRSDLVAETISAGGKQITQRQLSDLYHKKERINQLTAEAIERGYSLPVGWLSEDHSFVYSLTPADMNMHRHLNALPSAIRTKIGALIISLADFGKDSEQ